MSYVDIFIFLFFILVFPFGWGVGWIWLWVLLFPVGWGGYRGYVYYIPISDSQNSQTRISESPEKSIELVEYKNLRY